MQHFLSTRISEANTNVCTKSAEVATGFVFYESVCSLLSAFGDLVTLIQFRQAGGPDRLPKEGRWVVENHLLFELSPTLGCYPNYPVLVFWELAQYRPTSTTIVVIITYSILWARLPSWYHISVVFPWLTFTAPLLVPILCEQQNSFLFHQIFYLFYEAGCIITPSCKYEDIKY